MFEMRKNKEKATTTKIRNDINKENEEKMRMEKSTSNSAIICFYWKINVEKS